MLYPAAVVPGTYTEKSDVAALFGAARGCSVPDMYTGELNDMCRVFGKDNIEGERLFRVRAGGTGGGVCMPHIVRLIALSAANISCFSETKSRGHVHSSPRPARLLSPSCLPVTGMSRNP
jgi:hypothetical protein